MALERELDVERNETLGRPWLAPAGAAAAASEIDPEATEDLEDWNLLYALEGFDLDLVKGYLRLSPQIPGTWRSIRAPLFAPTFWGELMYKPTAHGGVTRLRVERLIALPGMASPAHSSGTAGLLLRSLQVAGPPAAPGHPPAVVHASLGQAPIGCRAALTPGGDLLITFDTPIVLEAGDRLEVEVH